MCSRFSVLVWLLAAAVSTAASGDDTAARRDIAEPQRLTHTHFSKFFLSFSPDGSHIVYSRRYPNRRAANQILVGTRMMRADGTEDRPLLPEFDAQVQIQEHPVFFPSGGQLLLSGGGNDTGNAAKDLFVCDVSERMQASKLRKIVAGAGVSLGEEPTISPDGKRIAFVSIDEQLMTSDAAGANKVVVVRAAGNYLHQPAWSPEGEWIAFASDRDDDVEIYKVRADGTDLTRLTHEPGVDCRPRWAPDGTAMVFTSNRGGNFDVYRMDSEGGNIVPLTGHFAADDHGVWTPDGRAIVFVSLRDGGFDVYRLELPASLRAVNKPASPGSRPTNSATPLVAHYDFDAANGPPTGDRAGRNRLVLEGARLAKVDGRSALEFDGAASFASCGNGADLRIAGPLTIALWVHPAAQSGNGYLISKQGWNIYLGPDMLPRFETRSANDAAWDTLVSPQTLKPNVWTHLAAVFDPARQIIELHVDGSLADSRARTDGALGATVGHPLELGHYVASRTQKFRGALREIRIYRRALSAAEIAALATVR